jgi:pre-mRNA-splicing factor RBM22/SLT11
MSTVGTRIHGTRGGESSDFPIVCQTCLGPNPYVRMTRERFGSACKICERPFTTFRWCPGAGMRFKKTEVCQVCAKLKNVCQTCLFDLEYGLPVEVRDKALGISANAVPRSDVNREYFIQNVSQALAADPAADGLGVTVYGGNFATGGVAPHPAGGRSELAGHELLKKLARRGPDYRRNLPHICSFFVKGICTRGDQCPYRHEMPTDPEDPLAFQNIRDRYYGSNDPLANKILSRVDKQSKLVPPEDKTITTLFIGGLEGGAVESSHIRDFFAQFGDIQEIRMVPHRSCAFIQFASRSAAEAAASSVSERPLSLNDVPVRIKWSRPATHVAGSYAADDDAGGSAAGRRRGGRSGLPGAATSGATDFPAVPGIPTSLPGLAAAYGSDDNDSDEEGGDTAAAKHAEDKGEAAKAADEASSGAEDSDSEAIEDEAADEVPLPAAATGASARAPSAAAWTLGAAPASAPGYQPVYYPSMDPSMMGGSKYGGALSRPFVVNPTPGGRR